MSGPSKLTPKLCSDLNDGKVVASDVGATITTVKEADFRQFVYELGTAVFKGSLKASKFVVGVKAVGHKHAGAPAEIADAFWLLWLEADDSPNKQQSVATMVQSTMKEGLVGKRVLMETGEVDFLEHTGLVNNADVWRNKEIRVNTRQIYRQDKYNMYREESEGYAKVITALNGHKKTAVTVETVPALTKYLQCLIGYFDLDPNRIFDAILAAYEQQPENRAYLSLLPNFTYKNTACLLGFKLSWHQKQEAGVPTPQHLLDVAATLLKEGYVTLDEIYAYLGPSDEDLVAASKQTAEAFEAAEAPEPLPAAPAPGQTNTARRSASSVAAGNAAAAAQASAASLQQVQREALHRAKLTAEAMPPHNQKLMLLQGLLEAGHWEAVYELSERLELLGVDPASDEGVASAMCSALQGLVAPEYSKLTAFVGLGAKQQQQKGGGKASRGGHKEAAQLPKEAAKLLCLLGPHLHTNQLLFIRVVRVLQSQLAAAGRGSSAEPLMLEVAEVLSSCLLPALELLPFNPALAEDVWALLRGFPYSLRFQVYSAVAALREEASILGFSARRSLEVARQVVSKCPAMMPSDRNRKEKDESKKFARTVVKISHAAPMAASEAILSHIESIGVSEAASIDAPPPVIEHTLRCVAFMTRLSTDVLCWSLLRRMALAKHEPAALADGSLAPWAVSLAAFAGHLCKRFSAVEIAPFLQVCLTSGVGPTEAEEGGDEAPGKASSSWSKATVFHELLLLQRLLEALAEVRPRDSLSEAEVEVEAGGVLLRKNAQFRQTYTNPRNLRGLQRSTARLLDALKSKDPAMTAPSAPAGSLLMAAAHGWVALQRRGRGQAKGGAASEQNAQRRLLEGAVDRFRAALLQYSAFLADALADMDAYAKLLPPVAEMHKMGFPPEIIFHLWRPCLSSQRAGEGEDSDDEGEGEGAGGLEAQVAKLVPEMAPQATWQSLSPSLYTTFWSLRLCDIHAAAAGYKSSGQALEDAARQLQSSRGGSSSEVQAKRQEAEKIKELAEQLPAELESRRKHVRQVRRRLQLKKDGFLSEVTDHRSSMRAFLQTCFLPRACLSPEDAIYCARFTLALHHVKTPYFLMVLFYDSLIKMVLALLQCCTAREASNLGMCLAEVLSTVDKYRTDAKLFASECNNTPGFLLSNTSLKGDCITLDRFKKLCNKWHNSLVVGLKSLMSSGDTMKAENGLSLLARVARVPFPAVQTMFKTVKAQVRDIKDKGSDSVLQAAASSCLKELEKVDQNKLATDSAHYSGAPSKAAPTKPLAAPPPAPIQSVTRSPARPGPPRSREQSPNRHRGERDHPPPRDRARGGGGGGHQRDPTPPHMRVPTPPLGTPERRQGHDSSGHPRGPRDAEGSPSRMMRQGGRDSPGSDLPPRLPPGMGGGGGGGRSRLRPEAEPFNPVSEPPGGKRHREPEHDGGSKRPRGDSAPSPPPPHHADGDRGGRGDKRSRGKERESKDEHQQYRGGGGGESREQAVKRRRQEQQEDQRSGGGSAGGGHVPRGGPPGRRR